MQHESISFPVYRKYKNNKSYFKISSLSRFEELQLVGSKVFLREVKAEQYPEKLFINDMLFNYRDMALEISDKEYEEVLARLIRT